MRSRPADAYRFARGETIGLPPYDSAGEPTRTARLSRPLDFAAVTDHSEFLAETDLCTDPASAAYGSRTCTTFRDGNFLTGDYGEFTAMLAFGRRTGFCLREPEVCAAALGAAWQEVQDAAEAAYDRTSSCTSPASSPTSGAARATAATRIREVQTCRWSGFVCRELSVDCTTIEADDPRATCCTEPSRHVIAERAWTSPVFYLPAP